MKKNRGITLSEILIAITILTFIGIAIFSALNTGRKSTKMNWDRMIATNIALSHLENLKAYTYKYLKENKSELSKTKMFKSTEQQSKLDMKRTTEIDTSVDGFVVITVKVTWMDGKTQKHVRVGTIVANDKLD